MVPVDPHWRAIANALHTRYRSYTKLQDALAEQRAIVDHAKLSRLCHGKGHRLTWSTGAALLNLGTSPRLLISFSMVDGLPATQLARRRPGPILAANTKGCQRNMTIAKIHLYELIQNVQRGDRVVSRVRFNVSVGGSSYQGCSCEIHQSPDNADDALIEVSAPPDGFPSDAPWNAADFANQIQVIYRRVIAASGAPHGRVMMNDRMALNERFTIELAD